MHGKRDLDHQVNVVMPGMAARAAKWKLGVTSYEGGASWRNAGGRSAVLFTRAQENRRMGMLYDQYLQAWQDKVGKDAVFQQYSIFSNGYGPEWPFAAIHYCGDRLKGAMKYDALLRASHAAGDCNLDGVVDFTDFQILAANFGGDGEKDKRWWSQGDFNNDQVVGLDDLKLLLANGKWETWPQAQQEQVKAFLAAHPGPYVQGPDPLTHQGTWTLATRQDQPQTIKIPAREDSGGTPAEYVLITKPRHGTVDVGNYPNVKYTPKADYRAIDDFVIAVKDGDGRQSNPVWVAVEVETSVAPSAKK
jgi:hypothetical protein